ncbi:MAG: MBL fold metallo-hydrolase [Desulfobacteraceae bacterium]|nr:MBL fold metallo-hydrolase [Desulfobacteraceae bacterium]
MEEIKEVGDRIYQVQVPMEGSNYVYSVYIIYEERAVLIDPGPASILPTIERAMNRIGLNNLAYIIPTHIHIDHGGGTGSLAKLFPEARVILHELGKEHLVDPSRLISSTKMAFGDDYETFLGPILPVPESRMIIPSDGEELSAGERKLRIIHAPGHAPHHIVIFDLKTGGLFCGEALGRRLRSAPSSPLPNAAPPGFDMEVYLETIQKLAALNPRTLYYAHDGVGEVPDALIAAITENTRIYADGMLNILRSTETDTEALFKIQEFVADRFGVDKADADERMAVGGFRVYYRKKGVLPD